MINIKVRTEYSFKYAYGHLQKIIDACDEDCMGICDRNSTWGHVQFQKKMKEAGKKPIFGVEIGVVKDAFIKEKQGFNYMSFIAKNNDGLKEIYALVTESTRNFYYEPRLDYSHIRNISENVFILSGILPDFDQLIKHMPNLYIELCPGFINAHNVPQSYKDKLKFVATSNNCYPKIEDKLNYTVAINFASEQTYPQHILDEFDWKEIFPGYDVNYPLTRAKIIADQCNAELPKAQMVKYHSDISLHDLCIELAPKKNIDLSDPIYKERFEREIKLIDEKNYNDYFFVIWDMLRYAKQHMLVGPARGSSCGSLVCFILSITEIDPIPFSLIFERFIDINRTDMPDIDIDFPDNKRDMVFDYAKSKYGSDCVARLGTVARFKAKSTITHVAKQLNIPAWEVNELKDAIIERSSGDARATFCIMDTFKELDIGKRIIQKYPHIQIAEQLEGHATHHGQHAAGIVVTEHPVNWYCSVNAQNGATQIDKDDAEELNLLKIDALGLRTLSVIQDCLDQIGWSREKIMCWPIDDEGAFKILQNKKYAGIFQFEGYALQSLCGQMVVENFEDISALTALARPGPLMSGGAAEYVARRTGKKKVEYMNKMVEELTQVTFGVIIYQEQVMHIARHVGKMEWEDVSFLRKAMSKSLGKEIFDSYWEKFKKGALENGLAEDNAREIWDSINTMGSWSFNRSHAIAYGMVSYWTCVLKSRFPMEYAAACLRHSKDDEQCIKLLRELVREGHSYVDFDKDRSEINWSVQDGILYGGLTGVKGIGLKTAQLIMDKRKAGEALTAAQQNKLDNAATPFKHAFKRDALFRDLIENPEKYNIASKITDIAMIDEDSKGEFLIFGELKKKVQRDHNELKLIAKRKYKMSGQTLFLNLTIEDDTGPIMCTITRDKYRRLGHHIVENVKVGSWIMIKGRIDSAFRSIKVARYKIIDPSEVDVSSVTE